MVLYFSLNSSYMPLARTKTIVPVNKQILMKEQPTT